MHISKLLKPIFVVRNFSPSLPPFPLPPFPLPPSIFSSSQSLSLSMFKSIINYSAIAEHRQWALARKSSRLVRQLRFQKCFAKLPRKKSMKFTHESCLVVGVYLLHTLSKTRYLSTFDSSTLSFFPFLFLKFRFENKALKVYILERSCPLNWRYLRRRRSCRCVRGGSPEE